MEMTSHDPQIHRCSNASNEQRTEMNSWSNVSRRPRATGSGGWGGGHHTSLPVKTAVKTVKSFRTGRWWCPRCNATHRGLAMQIWVWGMMGRPALAHTAHYDSPSHHATAPMADHPSSRYWSKFTKPKAFWQAFWHVYELWHRPSPLPRARGRPWHHRSWRVSPTEALATSHRGT